MLRRTIFSIFFGTLLGYYIIPDSFNSYSDAIIMIILSIFLFLLGVDSGRDKQIFENVKKAKPIMIMLPFFIALGSITGSALVGCLLSIPFNVSSSIGAGLGWFSLSGVMMTSFYSIEIGTIAFLSNFFRVIIAFIFMKRLNSYLGNYAVLASCGNTSMDIGLPLIKENLSSDIILEAVISGAILNIAAPILITILAKISL